MKLRLPLTCLSFVCALSLSSAPTRAGQPADAAVGTITGSVTNRTTGNGLEGAKVEIAALGVSGLVDKTGRYVLTGVPAGTHEVSASYWGLESARATLTVVASQRHALDFELTSSIYVLEAFRGSRPMGSRPTGSVR